MMAKVANGLLEAEQWRRSFEHLVDESICIEDLRNSARQNCEERRKRVRWQNLEEDKIREREVYSDLARQLSLSTEGRKRFITILDRLVRNGYREPSRKFSGVVAVAFKEWIDESRTRTDRLLKSDRSVCLKLARMEMKLTHVMCLLTVMLRAPLESEFMAHYRVLLSRLCLEDSVNLSEDAIGFCVLLDLCELFSNVLAQVLYLRQQAGQDDEDVEEPLRESARDSKSLSESHVEILDVFVKKQIY